MHVYDLFSYGGMIRDRVRTDAYARALRQCVKPGSVVLDMGTGVGIWALLACQFGARKVYAIDPNEVIQVARELASANGCADRIEFIQEMSANVTLPEPADVLVTEMHGTLPIYEQNLPSIIDARERLLAPGAAMIPQQETLWVAVAEAPDLYQQSVLPWADNAYGLDLRPALRLGTNMWRRSNARAATFVTEPECWATLDYRVLDSPRVHGEAECTATRDGTAHGLFVWFDSLLADGVTISNSPAAPETVFGRAFFPWPEPAPISRGDRISVAFRADLVSGEYVWRWETVVASQGEIKAEFKQSTFACMALSPAALQKRAANHLPRLNEDGQVGQFVLALMNGENSVAAIAEQAVSRFPGRFNHCHDALTAVADLSERYSR